MSAISASDVKKLRDRTGAGMMACKNALAEANGDFEKAVESLRARGEAQAAKRAGNEANQGTIQSYIHNGLVGVMVEVDCETDFVSRNDAFISTPNACAQRLANTLASQARSVRVSPRPAAPGVVSSKCVLMRSKNTLYSDPTGACPK